MAQWWACSRGCSQKWCQSCSCSRDLSQDPPNLHRNRGEVTPHPIKSPPTHPITLNKAGDLTLAKTIPSKSAAAPRWVCWFGSKSSCTNTHTGPRKGRTPLFLAGFSYFPQDLGEDGATFLHSPAEAAKRVMGGTKEDSISLLLIVLWRVQTAKVPEMLWVYNF